MNRAVATIIVAVVILLVLVAMYVGWRSRQRRQESLATTLPVPEDIGEELIALDLLYVGTTIAGEPLNRVAVSGLGFRARAAVTVARAGIVLAIAGERDAFIPADDILGVDRATWAIDRVVEQGGLMCVNWMLGDTAVDSYFRVVDPPDPTGLIDAVHLIIVGAADQRGTR